MKPDVSLRMLEKQPRTGGEGEVEDEERRRMEEEKKKKGRSICKRGQMGKGDSG